jgi:hypothetical protein
MMVDEKLFDDAVRIASLWLSKTEATDAQAFRSDVERSVQAVYHGLLAVRERITKGSA